MTYLKKRLVDNFSTWLVAVLILLGGILSTVFFLNSFILFLKYPTWASGAPVFSSLCAMILSSVVSFVYGIKKSSSEQRNKHRPMPTF